MISTPSGSFWRPRFSSVTRIPWATSSARPISEMGRRLHIPLPTTATTNEFRTAARSMGWKNFAIIEREQYRKQVTSARSRP